MITRATEYNRLLIPSLGVVHWVRTSADSQHTLMPIWLPQPTTVAVVTTSMRVLAQSGDIVSTGVVNLTRCPDLKRQNSTDTFLPAIARFLPIVRLCHIYSRREPPIRWTRHLYRSNIPRPYSPPGITMGCTPCHHVRLLNRFLVRCQTLTFPSVIPPPLPRLLPQALANHQSSWPLLSTTMLSHLSQTPTKRRYLPTMGPSRPALVRLRLSPTASRASPVPSTRNPGAPTSTRPILIHSRDASHSKRPRFSSLRSRSLTTISPVSWITFQIWGSRVTSRPLHQIHQTDHRNKCTVTRIRWGLILRMRLLVPICRAGAALTRRPNLSGFH